ncbi:MAG: ABC transporter ATP-binding protein [Anaerolineae bacterium]|jgi:ATP-binding cassette subfamily B protein|nr:ABC transporter ATP-binding protein [Chloroflexota bacterium]
MKKLHRVRATAALLIKYVRPYWRMALLLAVVLLGSIALDLVGPQLIKRFVDVAQAQGDQRQLVHAALTFLGVGIALQATRLAVIYLSTDLGFRSTNALRADLARHLMGLDMAFHKERTPGELIERIDGDVTSLSNFFTQFVVRLVGSGILIVGVLVLLVRENGLIGLAMGAFAGIALAGMLRYGGAAIADSAEERQANADLYGFIEERLGGLDDIRSNGSARYTQRRFYEALRRLYLAATTAWKKRLVVIRIAVAMWGGGVALALALAVVFYQRGAISMGGAYLLVHYTEKLFSPIEDIGRQLQDMQRAVAAIERVYELLALSPTITGEGTAGLQQAALPIRFDDVSFAYEDGEPVLQGISFQLQAGRTLGLLGRTGSGKTTLTRLLFRLYDPSQGVIRLGDVDLGGLNPEYLRSRVAMVTQEVQLFRASVRDNVTFFDPRHTDDEIERVLRDIGLGEWFEGLARGLDTELAPGGSDLSAGQAQLLAFARVFLTDPAVVVLDEPSSRLDPATERLLEQAMARLLTGRTGIIIAHRLATVQRVDDIMIIEQGRIAEFGERPALVNNADSLFATLLRTGLEEAFA